jgi:hypothetical protein
MVQITEEEERRKQIVNNAKMTIIDYPVDAAICLTIILN